MMKKAFATDRATLVQTSHHLQSDSSLQLVAATPPPPANSQYQVRVGHKLFQGSDTRHLLKLAVQARRSQLRARS